MVRRQTLLAFGKAAHLKSGKWRVCFTCSVGTTPYTSQGSPDVPHAQLRGGLVGLRGAPNVISLATEISAVT